MNFITYLGWYLITYLWLDELWWMEFLWFIKGNIWNTNMTLIKCQSLFWVNSFLFDDLWGSEGARWGETCQETLLFGALLARLTISLMLINQSSNKIYSWNKSHSPKKFSHATTALLSWHVITFWVQLISILIFEAEWKKYVYVELSRVDDLVKCSVVWVWEHGISWSKYAVMEFDKLSIS